MAKHGSASPREQKSRTLDVDLKRRARKLATDSRVDPRTRSLIRYGLEIEDQYLEQIVNRVEAGEIRIDHIRLDSDQVQLLSEPARLLRGGSQTMTLLIQRKVDSTRGRFNARLIRGRSFTKVVRNPTHGSGWMVQVLSTPTPSIRSGAPRMRLRGITKVRSRRARLG